MKTNLLDFALTPIVRLQTNETKPNQTKNQDNIMAILRSSDGKFYEVADDQLSDKLIPADQIKERLGAVGVGPAQGPVGPGPQMMVPGTGGQVVIQIYTSSAEGGYMGGPEGGPAEGEGDVEAHDYCWRRNYFNNCWQRNCWRNSCY